MGDHDPKCPQGCGGTPRPLMSSDTANRYQCGNIDCLREFSVPKSGSGPSSRPDAESKEANVANLGECVKGCGRKKWSGAGPKAMHEKYCMGLEASKLPLPARKKSKREKPARKPRAGSKPESGGIKENVIKMLEDKRAERVAILIAEDAELLEIDTLITALGGRPS